MAFEFSTLNRLPPLRGADQGAVLPGVAGLLGPTNGRLFYEVYVVLVVSQVVKP